MEPPATGRLSITIGWPGHISTYLRGARRPMPTHCGSWAASPPARSWTFGCCFDPAQLKPPPQTENPLLVLDAHLLEGRPPIGDVAGEPRLEGGAPQHAVPTPSLETLDHGGGTPRGEDL